MVDFRPTFNLEEFKMALDGDLQTISWSSMALGGICGREVGEWFESKVGESFDCTLECGSRLMVGTYEDEGSLRNGLVELERKNKFTLNARHQSWEAYDDALCIVNAILERPFELACGCLQKNAKAPGGSVKSLVTSQLVANEALVMGHGSPTSCYMHNLRNVLIQWGHVGWSLGWGPKK
ncbi:hypothetical protein VNO78_04864 [Psophocarpus tetragonolobus]|uniref:Uncharacterized protein n=1 Tax=Psophocarpus tetragonolobus TaxID=3891 RepID=A0AAN9TGP3_PSOTE